MNELSAILQRLNDSTTYPAVLATLVRVEGSSYRRTGARWLLDARDGRIGSISGGCLEDDLVERARQMRHQGRAHERVVYDTSAENDLVWGVGLGCHGIVEIVLELLPRRPDWADEVRWHLDERQPVEIVVGASDAAGWGTRLPDASTPAEHPDALRQQLQPPPALVVFGAGDDARPLARLGAELGWSITIVDPRPDRATRERFPEVRAVQCLAPEEAAAALRWDVRTAAVVMTHHYVFDRPLLRALLPLELPYLGLLGPRQRADRILAELEADGIRFPAAARERLHAPVGLDLGDDGPAAVALSIVAEIQARLNGRDAAPLRERHGPIHGR